MLPIVLGSPLLCGFDHSLIEPPSHVERDADAGIPQAPPTPPVPSNPYDLPNSASSIHFVVRWGDAYEVGPHIDDLLADLERSWDFQVRERGWAPPVGTYQQIMNVYLAGSDPRIPALPEGAAGVVIPSYTTPPEMVLHPEIFSHYERGTSQPLRLIAHEFNHALQFGVVGAYLAPEDAFYFEATANWMAGEQTASPHEYQEWGDYLLHPEYSLTATDGDRALRPYHAAMFVEHLAQLEGPDRVRDSWMNADERDVLTWLDDLLELGVVGAFTDFAVTHATGDHDLVELYDQALQRPGRRVTGRFYSSGGDFRPTAEQAPEGLAWNHLIWQAGQRGNVRIGFVGEANGDEGTPSVWSTVASVERDGRFEHVPFEGSTELAVEAGDEVHLVLVAAPDTVTPGERFSYTATLEPSRGACGCSAGAEPSTSSWTSLFRRR